MEKVDKYLYDLHEGIINTVLCKKNRLGIKLNKRNSLIPTKKRLKDCDQYKKTNPARYKACVKYYQKLISGTEKAIARCQAGVDKYCRDKVSEAGFEEKPKGWTDKSISKFSGTLTKKMKGGVKSKGFFDKCVKKMQGKVKNPEGFCAALKDEAYGSTYWRGKDKAPAEVKKDVAKHKNV